MHGIIFGELKKLVDKTLGGNAWRQLLHDAGLDTKIYMPIGEYPDADAAAIIAAAAARTGKPVRVVMEEFGEFVAPDLIALFRHMVTPEWRTLELLENTEDTIHRVVRLRNPGAHPPRLKTERSGEEVVITYMSARQMCGVAVGIVRGLARYYGETVVIQEPSCMLEGSSECTIRVRRIRSSGSAHSSSRIRIKR
jgi:hypothetical protein